MTQKRLLLSDSLVWAGVILARAVVWCCYPAGRLRRAVGRTLRPLRRDLASGRAAGRRRDHPSV